MGRKLERKEPLKENKISPMERYLSRYAGAVDSSSLTSLSFDDQSPSNLRNGKSKKAGTHPSIRAESAMNPNGIYYIHEYDNETYPEAITNLLHQEDEIKEGRRKEWSEYSIRQLSVELTKARLQKYLNRKWSIEIGLPINKEQRTEIIYILLFHIISCLLDSVLTKNRPLDFATILGNLIVGASIGIILRMQKERMFNWREHWYLLICCFILSYLAMQWKTIEMPSHVSIITYSVLGSITLIIVSLRKQLRLNDNSNDANTEDSSKQVVIEVLKELSTLPISLICLVLLPITTAIQLFHEQFNQYIFILPWLSVFTLVYIFAIENQSTETKILTTNPWVFRLQYLMKFCERNWFSLNLFSFCYLLNGKCAWLCVGKNLSYLLIKFTIHDSYLRTPYQSSVTQRYTVYDDPAMGRIGHDERNERPLMQNIHPNGLDEGSYMLLINDRRYQNLDQQQYPSQINQESDFYGKGVDNHPNPKTPTAKIKYRKRYKMKA